MAMEALGGGGQVTGRRRLRDQTERTVHLTPAGCMVSTHCK